MKKLMLSAISAVVGIGFVQAKTIALWPIEFGEGTVGLTSVGPVDASLTKGAHVSDAVFPAGGNVPASYVGLGLPDADVTNRTRYARSTSVNAKGYHFTVPDFGAKYCSHTNDAFTVEGYFTIEKFPASGNWVMLVGSQYMAEDSNKFRWHVSISANKDGIRFGYKPAWGVSQEAIYSPYFDEDERAHLTDEWNHFAYTYQKPGVDGLACARFYLNGKLMFEDCRAVRTDIGSSVAPWTNLDFGGISQTPTTSALAGAFDYIRVSNEALSPDEFLNAASADDSPTVAYWKLDWTADGLLNTRPSVGMRQLNGLLPGAAAADSLTDSNADFVNDMDAGTPSNLSMTPAPTGETGNKGCLWLHGEKAYVQQKGVGAQLALTNSFTVECWIRPCADMTPTFPKFPQVVFGTGHATSGWTLSLASAEEGSFYYRLDASDNKTQLLGASGTDVSGTFSAQDVWQHLALTYDHTAGNGTWSLYLDGVLKKTAANAQAPVNGPASANLTIGAADSSCFRGYLDYMRVSRAALAPEQFLNAASGTAATDVLALWPLDVYTDDGVRFDGRDAAAGVYPLSHARTGDAYKVTRYTTDLPTIRNPDQTRGFVGNPAVVNAATEFRKSGSVGNRSYLMSTDPKILDILNSRAPYTIECFARRTGSETTDQNYLFGSFCNVKGNGVTVSSVLGYQKSHDGFFTHDRIWQGNKSSGVSIDFPKSSFIEDGKWHHVAWQREFVGESTARYTLWLDGECIGTTDETVSSIGNAKATAFFVGGRSETSDKQQWRGAISSVRVSNRLLDEKEFLNAKVKKNGLILIFW